MFDHVVIFEDAHELEQVAFLIVVVDLDFPEDVLQHGAEGDDGVHPVLAKQFHALSAVRLLRGQSGQHEYFGKGCGVAYCFVSDIEKVFGFFEDVFFEEFIEVGAFKFGGGEGVRMPGFDGYDGAGDAVEVVRERHERNFATGKGVRVVGYEVDFFARRRILFATLKLILAQLPNEEAVQLKIFTHYVNIDSGHITSLMNSLAIFRSEFQPKFSHQRFVNSIYGDRFAEFFHRNKTQLATTHFFIAIHGGYKLFQ